MPLLKKKSLLAAKIETTSGTFESLADADAAFNVFDMALQPTITFTPRQGNGSFSQMRPISEIQSGTCTFTTEIYGDGNGGVPTWASTFLPACGFVAGEGQVYTPLSQAPATNVKTISIAAYVDGKVKKLRGCAGSFVMNFESGRLATITWTFTGAWVGVDDLALLTPTYPTILPFRVANAVFDIDGWNPCFQSLSIDAGNEVFIRPCATIADTSGVAAAIITGRTITGTVNPETELAATHGLGAEPYDTWLTSTTYPFQFELTDGVDTFTIDMPAWQAINIQEGDRDSVVTDEITFQANRSVAAGDDEMSITFS